MRAARGLRSPLALPDWFESAGRVFLFDPERQSVPGLPGFRGVRLYHEALGCDEADRLLRELDRSPWIASQSGKQKQHHGPRFNFARRRMNAERFTGLPDWAHALEARLRTCVDAEGPLDPAREGPSELAACRAALARYATTDVFALRYRESWASNLDLHVDDVYAYGEVILDVSLDTDSILTFVGPTGPVELPTGELDRSGQAGPKAAAQAAKAETEVCVRVPLPARSIAVLYGPARFGWSHGVLARDIRGMRTSITLRTLAPALRDTEPGRRVLELARCGSNTTQWRLP